MLLHCPSDIPDPSFGSGIWVRNRGSGIFPDPRKIPWIKNFSPNQYSLPKILNQVNFRAKNDGFKGKFLVLENFLGSGKIPDPRFQTQIPDPMVGSGMSDGQSHCSKILISWDTIFVYSRCRTSWPFSYRWEEQKLRGVTCKIVLFGHTSSFKFLHL